MGQFEYVMALISVVVGLGLTHILSALGVAIHRMRGHGAPIKLEPVYLLWVLLVLILLTSFWWWEFKLQEAEGAWTLPVYFFLITYAISYFLIVVILVPDRMEGLDNSFEYFISVRHWFFGMLLANQMLDVLDTSLKGWAWLTRPNYVVQALIYFSVCIIGMLTKRRSVHLAIAALIVAVQVFYILLEMNVLGS